MADSDDDFLARWSRLKRERSEGRRPEPVVDAADPERPVMPAVPDAGGEAALTEEEAARRQALVEQLPDIETLDETSDFTAFLQEGVPEALRRRALRKLWRLNPVFANLDGLNDYDDDFTDAATVVQGLKTLYQVGKGMVAPEEEKPDETVSVAGAEALEDDGPSQVPEDRDGSVTDRNQSSTAESPGEESPAALEKGSHEAASTIASADGESETTSAALQPQRGGAARRRWRRFDT